MLYGIARKGLGVRCGAVHQHQQCAPTFPVVDAISVNADLVYNHPASWYYRQHTPTAHALS